ncbi:MAG: hypothetical protein H0T53_10365 [Herpetosiphonaceae bacterium]|nr:hypothetical protein [Herpetosiphonaceae bacterium]
MSNPSESGQQRSTAEWLSLVISLLLLATVVGIIIFLWITPSDEAVQFSVQTAQAREVDGVFYLPVTVRNAGDSTAGQVLLEGSLMVDGQEEAPTTTLDFVPGHSEREATLIFSADPAQAEIRIVSYQKP